MRGLYLIDHFIMSNSIRARITDAKRVETGVDSDHSAIKLKMHLKVSLKCKKKYKAPRKIVPDWDLLQQPKNALTFQAEKEHTAPSPKHQKQQYHDAPATMKTGSK
jgi:hypothetical protein